MAFIKDISVVDSTGANTVSVFTDNVSEYYLGAVMAAYNDGTGYYDELASNNGVLYTGMHGYDGTWQAISITRDSSNNAILANQMYAFNSTGYNEPLTSTGNDLDVLVHGDNGGIPQSIQVLQDSSSNGILATEMYAYDNATGYNAYLQSYNGVLETGTNGWDGAGYQQIYAYQDQNSFYSLSTMIHASDSTGYNVYLTSTNSDLDIMLHGTDGAGNQAIYCTPDSGSNYLLGTFPNAYNSTGYYEYITATNNRLDVATHASNSGIPSLVDGFSIGQYATYFVMGTKMHAYDQNSLYDEQLYCYKNRLETVLNGDVSGTPSLVSAFPVGQYGNTVSLGTKIHAYDNNSLYDEEITCWNGKLETMLYASDGNDQQLSCLSAYVGGYSLDTNMWLADQSTGNVEQVYSENNSIWTMVRADDGASVQDIVADQSYNNNSYVLGTSNYALAYSSLYQEKIGADYNGNQYWMCTSIAGNDGQGEGGCTQIKAEDDLGANQYAALRVRTDGVYVAHLTGSNSITATGQSRLHSLIFTYDGVTAGDYIDIIDTTGSSGPTIIRLAANGTDGMVSHTFTNGIYLTNGAYCNFVLSTGTGTVTAEYSY